MGAPPQKLENIWIPMKHLNYVLLPLSLESSKPKPSINGCPQGKAHGRRWENGLLLPVEPARPPCPGGAQWAAGILLKGVARPGSGEEPRSFSSCRSNASGNYQVLHQN